MQCMPHYATFLKVQAVNSQFINERHGEFINTKVFEVYKKLSPQKYKNLHLKIE